GDYVTPLGKAAVNRDIANRLRKEHMVFNFPLTAHNQEHSIEVQIPLIQHYFSTQPEIIPIIIGSRNNNTLRRIANALRPWFTPDNLFIISSDFSHYPSYEDANVIDDLTAEGLVSGDPKVFLETLRRNSEKNITGLSTSMCAHTSGLVLLYLAEGNKNLEFKRIDYCNSGDSPFGDKDGVVGYHAIALAEKGDNPGVKGASESDFSFTEAEINELLNIARNNIKTVLAEGKRTTAADPAKAPPALRQPMGAFVTIRIDGKLRGCIGRFTSSDPLCEVVRSSAVSSAFEDPRFSPLTSEEFEKCDLEITVLGPLKKIKSIDEIILGKHGIYIRKDQRSGTMLPQVATEQGWNVEEFLGFTSREKAGLDWDGWKDAEIFIYEGLVLGEKSN
ncbi:MAG: AmmeMemoRadiSam system protein A, partial [Bacteroidales bacterium]|nr:AmmeMemoRadiSam system protein A [Bacteroidales bacterium]